MRGQPALGMEREELGLVWQHGYAALRRAGDGKRMAVFECVTFTLGYAELEMEKEKLGSVGRHDNAGLC